MFLTESVAPTNADDDHAYAAPVDLRLLRSSPAVADLLLQHRLALPTLVATFVIIALIKHQHVEDLHSYHCSLLHVHIHCGPE